MPAMHVNPVAMNYDMKHSFVELANAMKQSRNARAQERGPFTRPIVRSASPDPESNKQITKEIRVLERPVQANGQARVSPWTGGGRDPLRFVRIEQPKNPGHGAASSDSSRKTGVDRLATCSPLTTASATGRSAERTQFAITISIPVSRPTNEQISAAVSQALRHQDIGHLNEAERITLQGKIERDVHAALRERVAAGGQSGVASSGRDLDGEFTFASFYSVRAKSGAAEPQRDRSADAVTHQEPELAPRMERVTIGDWQFGQHLPQRPKAPTAEQRREWASRYASAAAQARQSTYRYERTVVESTEPLNIESASSVLRHLAFNDTYYV